MALTNKGTLLLVSLESRINLQYLSNQTIQFPSFNLHYVNMSSGYLPKMAKLETKAVIRIYLPPCSLATGSTNMVFSVLKD